MISQEYLKEILQYDPITGDWTWRKSLSRKIVIGSKAGSFDSRGYLQIGILNSNYRAHRLAFLYMEGNMPKEVDHIDRNTKNCKWSNLRKCTHEENLLNRVSFRNSETGRYESRSNG